MTQKEYALHCFKRRHDEGCALFWYDRLESRLSNRRWARRSIFLAKLRRELKDMPQREYAIHCFKHRHDQIATHDPRNWAWIQLRYAKKGLHSI